MVACKPRSWPQIIPKIWVVVVVLGGCSVVAREGEPGLGTEGEPCSPWGSYACSLDGTEELVCEEGWYALSRACPGGCTLSEGGSSPLLSCLENATD